MQIFTNRSVAALTMVAAFAAPAAAAQEVPQAYVESCARVDQPARSCIEEPAAAPAGLDVGASARSWVDAQCRWNRTGVLTQMNALYEVEVIAQTEAWFDDELESDLATGWIGRIARLVGFFARGFARDVHSPMYALIAAQGKEGNDYTLVGSRGAVTGTREQPAELLLFANDWPSKYQNNHGCLKVQITRKR